MRFGDDMGMLELFSRGIMLSGDLDDRTGDDAVEADLNAVESRGTSARLPSWRPGAKAIDEDRVEEVLDVFRRS